MLVLAVVAAVGPARPAGAHAAFVSSDPEPGSRLSAAPGVVVLRFSEPLIPDLSEAVVVDPNGERFTSEPTGDRSLEVRLRTTAPGVYDVKWRTVSPLDGHTLRGSFRFGVGTDPGPGAEGGPSTSPEGSDLLVGLARAVEYAALLAAMGMLLLGRLAGRPPPLPWVRSGLRPVLVVALLAGIAVVGSETLQAAGSLSAAPDFLESRQGAIRLLRLVATAAALAGAWFRRGSLVAGALLGTFLALASAGHAAASHPFWLAVVADAGHLATAGLWAGGVLALATVRPPGGWRGPPARALLDRFTPVALPAFVATVAFGVVRGFQELATVGDVFDTAYGQVLGVKVLVVAAMVPFSVLAWRRLGARPRSEAALALAVMVAAGSLAAFPLPPQRAAEADEGEAVSGRSEALPRPGDLTFASATGDVLVGLTVRPGASGTNRLLVYLLPVEGAEAAAGLDVRLAVDGQPSAASRCGPACRAADAQVDGGERVDVEVNGTAGGTARFVLPELPAPDAADLVAAATRRMNRLGSYRIDEELAPLDPPLESEYTIVAPDRLRFATDRGLVTVRIGTTRYTQASPDAEWEVTRGGPAVEVPVVIWDYPNPIAAHVVDRERMRGQEVTVISFFIEVHESPIWYRLWVADDALVLRAEMRTRGHFMDHEYSAFDEPLTVDPPDVGEDDQA